MRNNVYNRNTATLFERAQHKLEKKGLLGAAGNVTRKAAGLAGSALKTGVTAIGSTVALIGRTGGDIFGALLKGRKSRRSTRKNKHSRK